MRAAALAVAAFCAAAVGAQERPAATLKLLDVPYLAQSPELCGGAAAAMVLRYWGFEDVNDTDFAHLVEDRVEGIRTGALVAAVRARGLEVVESRGDPDALARELDAGRPPLILVEVADDVYHYVVPLALTADAVVLHDPAIGPFRVVPLERLLEQWRAARGWMAALAPALDTEAAGEPAPPAAAIASEAVEDPCAARVAGALKALDAGGTGAADALLTEAREACPESALVFRESAAARFRASDWSAASALAERAVDLDPGDLHAWRILATSRYLHGEAEAALDAWNRADEPTIDLVHAPGIGALRFPVLQRRAGVRPGERLTRARLELARRRIDDLPVAAAAAVSYTPRPGGRVDVTLGVVRRAGFGLDLPSLARNGWSALTERRITLDLAGPGGSGELLRSSWSFRPGRRGLELGLASPEPFGVTGIGHVAAAVGEETFAGTDGPERESRRRGAFGLSHWLDAGTRVHGALAVERWSGRTTDVAIEAGVERRFANDRAALGLRLVGAASPGGSPGYARVELGGRFRSHGEVTDAHWIARASWIATGAGAPRGVWPRAGTGATGERPLRAHPLLIDGVVAGEGFTPRMLHGSIEGRVFPWRVGPLAFGPAAFVDGARVAGHAGSSSRTLVALGAGLRATAPGIGGLLRLDGAVGLAGGGPTISLGWQSE